LRSKRWEAQSTTSNSKSGPNHWIHALATTGALSTSLAAQACLRASLILPLASWA